MANIESIAFYLIALDAVMANLMVWSFPKWYKKNHKGFWKHFLASKGWAALYLILVIWLGTSLNRLGLI